MTSNTIKQTCDKCNKGGGIARCNGCQRSFCVKHFIEHRQELSQQMDDVGQEHDLLRRDMNYETNTQAFLVRIHQWEQDAIRMVQESAKKARIDLQRVIDQTKNDLQISMHGFTEELRACRETEDYTEIDIRKWIEQLRGFRQMIGNTSSINIECEENANGGIPLIKISLPQRTALPSNEERRLHAHENRIFNASFEDKFGEIHGSITLSADGLTGVCLENRWDGSCASGIGRYSSGVHHIRLRIEHKTSQFLFFGIITASQKLTSSISKVKSVYGWWDLSFAVIGGAGITSDQTKHIHSGDDITLILDCDNCLIQLRHHRFNKLVHLPIDLEQCPFPWKIVIRLDAIGDCVKILH